MCAFLPSFVPPHAGEEVLPSIFSPPAFEKCLSLQSFTCWSAAPLTMLVLCSACARGFNQHVPEQGLCMLQLASLTFYAARPLFMRLFSPWKRLKVRTLHVDYTLDLFQQIQSPQHHLSCENVLAEAVWSLVLVEAALWSTWQMQLPT